MKKYILALGFCLLTGTYNVFSQEQTEAQQELEAYMSEGIVKFKSKDDNFSFRVGGRVAMDGAYYFDDFTDRGSGAKFSAARIRLFSQIGKKLDIKLDFDFASKSVLKDAYLRWHTNKNGFIKVGNYAEPFSAENIQSSMDYPFINKSATVEALGTGRALGFSYRYYHNYFWIEGGMFSQKFATEYNSGDMGYSASARLLGRLTNDDWNLHIGGSVNFRRPDANGFTSGSDDFNRQVTYASGLESCIDNTKFLNASVSNVKSVFKYGIEGMANYRNVYLKGEYIHAKNTRERDWEYNFQSSLGSLLSTMFPTMDAYKNYMGGDSPAQFSGYTVEAGVLIMGGNYKYNKIDALMNRPKGKSLELVVRYNHTDLNDIMDGNIFYNGAFYTSSLHASFGLKDQSVSGGKADTFTVGLNYYITDNIVTRLNYSYQKVDNQYNLPLSLDKNLHSVQARLAFEF